ncbi:MAG TPA: decaprenyl-phosphate phosphoribosyltransferase [Dehalococcoidia bacterium]|nr:decaprenyl-phosphate phosphoribosyltransferase [Dehalococcoidia bacterium]
MIDDMAKELLSSRWDGSVSLTKPVTLLRHLRVVLKEMRPRQWAKNGIVFMAFIFSANQFWQPKSIDSWDHLVVRAFLTALVFCMASGAEYMINDLRDRESDRLHPRKRNRPIAAGLISPAAAAVWAVSLTAIAFAGAFAIDWRTGIVVVAYVGLTLAYSYVLKYEVILDVMAIAAGFVLRAVAGAYAIDVPVSPWLYVVTALGALFLAITKRRAEVGLLQDDAANHRSTLALYTPALLDQMTAMVTASTVIAYALYTFTAEYLPKNHMMMLTIPFVAYGIFRYLYLSLTKNEGGSPEEVLLKDIPMMVTVVLWVVTSMVVLTAYR